MEDKKIKVFNDYINNDYWELPFLMFNAVEVHDVSGEQPVNPALQPYYDLMWAMLERAVLDIRNGHEFERKDAAKWITSPTHRCDSSKDCFSFKYIVEQLNLSPVLVDWFYSTAEKIY